MAWNIGGSKTAIQDIVNWDKLSKNSWCMILTEVKYAAWAMRSKLRKTHTIHMSNEYKKMIKGSVRRGEKGIELRGGVIVALNKPFGQMGQHDTYVPEGMKGNLVHVTQKLPGGKQNTHNRDLLTNR